MFCSLYIFLTSYPRKYKLAKLFLLDISNSSLPLRVSSCGMSGTNKTDKTKSNCKQRANQKIFP